MTDLHALAALAHLVADTAIVAARRGGRATDITDDVLSICGGEREVVALALSYALRADEDTNDDLSAAVDGLVRALRRLATDQR